MPKFLRGISYEKDFHLLDIEFLDEIEYYFFNNELLKYIKFNSVKSLISTKKIKRFLLIYLNINILYK